MNAHCMQTYTGRIVDLTRFCEDDICIEDIAHALSQIIRFTGHSRAPYSVAQHSLLVAEIATPEHRLWALLHDASEAYLGDVASPLKTLLPEYRDLEEKFQKVIAGRFGLPWPMPAEVKHADRVALMTEKRDLLLTQHEWPGEFTPDNPLHIHEILPCWDAKFALMDAVRECLKLEE
jgi:5'-deoxynucleotidase YfbR-like HD superfamily hydrolase